MRRLLLILFFIAAIPSYVFAQLSGNGTSSNPYTGIINSNTQWNNSTVYVGNIQINQGVTLTVAPGTTLVFDNDANLIVDGTLVANGSQRHITFTSRSADDTWGHIEFSRSSANNIIDSCIFEYGNGDQGGAIENRSLSVLNISNSIFRYNSSIFNGGAICCFENATANVSNCLFESNTAIAHTDVEGGGGGAIAVLGATLNVENCIFRNNTANDLSGGTGGAIFIDYIQISEDVDGHEGHGSITNSLFEENECGSYTENKGGGAVSVLSGCTLDINNCTFINNVSYHQEVAANALQISFSEHAIVRNSVFWSSTPGNQIYLFTTNNVFFSHCAYIQEPYIFESEQPSSTGCTLISTNNSGDSNSPLFADPINHIWSLEMASPCINASDNQATSHDIYGQYAVGTRDIGAFELVFAVFNGLNGTPVASNYYDIFDARNWTASPFDPDDSHRIIMDAYIPTEDGHNAFISSDLSIASGASLVVNAGRTIALTSGTNILVDGTFIVRGNNNTPVLLTDYNNGTWGHIYLRPGSLSDFSYCTIQNGSSDNGGAIRVNTTNPINISNAHFSNNQASQNGGAIYIDNGGRVNIDAVTFASNLANNGGAIYTNSSTVISGASSFNNNSARQGGAIYLNNGNSNISTATAFTSNHAAQNGGAIYINATSTIDNVTLTSNNAINGGAIYINAGESAITNVHFGTTANSSANTASNGGAVYVAGGTPSFTSSEFTNNSASAQGGAVYTNGGNPSFMNSYFTGNNSTSAGGAMSFSGSSASGSVINCIFEANTSNGGITTTTGSAMAISNGAVPYVRNCTFVENTNSNGLQYTLMLNGAGSDAQILNNVFWRSSGSPYSVIVCANRNDLARISYCAYTENPYIVSESANVAAAHSILINYDNDGENGPYFNDNWSIKALSALRNAGNPAINGTIDILGNAQVGIRDIGAFEATVAYFIGGAIAATIGGNYYDFYESRNWSTNPFDGNNTTIIMDISIPIDSRFDVYISRNVTIPHGITFNIEGERRVYIAPNTSITVNGELNANQESSSTVTFTGSSSNGWSHIKYNSNTVGVLNNCIFEYADSSALQIAGHVTINHSTFRNNSTPNRGGATYTSGGAIFVTRDGVVDISQSTFNNNEALNGGAIRYDDRSSGTILASLFNNNRIIGNNNNGGAISLNTSGNVQIINCTFVNNVSTTYGDLLRLMGSGNYSIINSVFWNRNSRNSYPITVSGSSTYRFQNCAQTLSASNPSPIAGCFAISYTNDDLNPKGPHFRNPASNDWSILPYSPLRDAGIARPDGMATTDINGDEMVRLYDIGAYEAQFAYWTGASTADLDNGEIIYDDWSIDYVKAFESPDNWSVYPLDQTGTAIMDIVIPNYEEEYTVLHDFDGTGHRLTLPADRIIVVEPLARLNIPYLDIYGKMRLQSDELGNNGGYRSTLGYDSHGSGVIESELWLSGGINTSVGPDAYRWHYIASPFPNTSTAQFEAQTLNLSKYDNELGWIAYDGYVYNSGTTNSSEAFNTMELGHGYNYYSDTDHMYLLTGANPNFFDYYVPLDSGWNLVGNPFPTGADWNVILGQNWQYTDDFNHGFYYTKDNRQYSYVNGIETPLPDDGEMVSGRHPANIPPYQGFFVKAYTDSVNLYLPINAKVSHYDQRYKGEPVVEEIPYVRLSLKSDSVYFDDTVIRFGTGPKMTIAVNDSLDAYKAFKKDSQTLIYSSMAGEEFSIKSLPIPDTSSIEIPINVQILERGNYTIGVRELQNLDDYKIFLKDKETGSYTQVVSTKSGISFTSDGGTFDRFSLVLYGNNIPTEVEDIDVDVNGFKVYASNGTIRMIPLAGGWDAKTANVRIIDMTGKIISMHNSLGFTTNTETSIPAPKTTGIYIVEIYNNADRIVEKVFVR